jgi:UPF0716 protein FxsA
MLPLLLLLFIVVPIVELYVIIQVGEQIGALPTIAILVADSILGSMLLRTQSRGVWRRFNDTLAAGRPPAREVLDGVLVIFGGALLLTPGFITDVFGCCSCCRPRGRCCGGCSCGGSPGGSSWRCRAAGALPAPGAATGAVARR